MTVIAEEKPTTGESTPQTLITQYLSTLSYIERLHRLLLDVVKDEFERVRILDITSVQALLLFNIGDKEVTVGELKSRGYYQGSNVSYNLKKLVESGYIKSERCSVDRRTVRLKLTDEGCKIHQIVSDLWQRHVDTIDDNDLMSLGDFERLGQSMHTLERYWTDNIRYIY